MEVLVIVGFLLTLLSAIPAFLWCKERLRDRYLRKDFRRVFGPSPKTYHLTFGTMTVHPDLIQAVSNLVQRLHQENASPQVIGALDQLTRFPLAKPSRPNNSFSAQKVASGCEIRAVSYMSQALHSYGELATHVTGDDDISAQLDIDFVAFGALTNLKTIEAFRNRANNLATYDESLRFFVSKNDGSKLYEPRKGFDYGLVLKINPTEFRKRFWICCAGWGEWGTSGAAWYLANRWRELAVQISENEQFAALIEVEVGKDQSANLVRLIKT